MLEWTDEEHYQQEICRYDDEDIGPEGEVYSTYNQKSKWDWWMVGGRWDRDVANIFPVKEALEKEDVPYAVVTPDGEWHERGEMGWFGCASNEKELDVWKETVLKLYSENMNCKIVLCDLHI